MAAILFNIKSREDFADGAHKKRRVRTFKSCSLCRHKKIKCDQQKPACGGCLKRGRVHLCQYEEQKWSINVANDSEERILSSNSEDSTPSVIESHVIDFYSNTFPSPITVSQGPLTWVAMLKRDKYANSVSISHKARSALIDQHSKLHTDPLKLKDDKFIKKWNREFSNDIQVHHLQEHKTSENSLASIQKYFNDVKLAWLLIDRFFETELYMVLPFLDKVEFLEQLTKLIGPKSSQSITIQLKKTTDLAVIGIALLIMRVSSFTVFNFNQKNSKSSQSIDYIRSNPIPHDITHLLTVIQEELLLIKTPHIEIFQFLSIKAYCILFSPEDGDCIKFSNQGTVGELLQYAIQCSLNRDPVNSIPASSSNMFGGNSQASKNKNLLRRLWYQVINLDFVRFSWIGYPSLIDKEYYDTELPTFEDLDKEDFTGSDEEMVNVLNKFVSDRVQQNESILNVLKVILSLKNRPTVDELKKTMDHFALRASKLKRLREIVEISQNGTTRLQRCENIRHFMALMETTSLLAMIEYQMFIYYSHKNDVENAMVFLLKTFKTSEIIFESLLFIDPDNEKYDLEKTFGIGCFVYPKIEACVHRLLPLFFGMLSRLKYFKLSSIPQQDSQDSSLKNSFKSSLSIDIIKITDSITEMIEDITRDATLKHYNISDTYFHAWVFSKVQLSILDTILKPFKGEEYNGWTLEDLNFMKTLNRFKDVDYGLAGDPNKEETQYKIEHFEKIQAALKPFIDIVNWRNQSKYGGLDQDPDYDQDDSDSFSILSKPYLTTTFDAQLNDLKWFDKMIEEYSTQGDVEISTQSEFFPEAITAMNLSPGSSTPSSQSMSINCLMNPN